MKNGWYVHKSYGIQIDANNNRYISTTGNHASPEEERSETESTCSSSLGSSLQRPKVAGN